MSNQLVSKISYQDSDLQRYIASMSHIKILTQSEEENLLKRYYQENDLKAGHELVISHLPLVLKLAFGYRGYNISLIDIIAEGNVGLLKALEKFDPSLGNRFATYATWWIKAQITDFILNSWSLVKVGTHSARKKLFFSLNRIKKKLKIETRDLSNTQVVAISNSVEGISGKDVVDINNMLNKTDVSLSSSVSKLEGGNVSLEHTLSSADCTPEEQIADKEESNFYKKAIADAFKNLSHREQVILKRRYLGEQTVSLKNIASELGISRERVRQIEQEIISKIKKQISN